MTTPTRPQTPAARAPRELLSPLTFSIAAIVLVVAVFALYSPSLGFQFILDEHRFINDPRVQSSGHVWEYFTNYVWAQFQGGPSSFYRPLFIFWLRMNFLLSEMSSWGWHLLSIDKHICVALLLGWLTWKLLRDRVAALLCATLFAVHPAQTESVAWVTVPDPLMAAGVIGALLLYLRYAAAGSAGLQADKGRSARKSRKGKHQAMSQPAGILWLSASALAYLAALLVKETAIILPVVIFAVAFLPGRQSDETSTKDRIIRALRQIIPFVAATLIYFLLRWNALGRWLSAPTQHLSWKTELLSWPAALWFYIKVLLWPVRSYAFADSPETNVLSLRGVLLPALGLCCFVVALAGLIFWIWRKAQRELPGNKASGVVHAVLFGLLLLALPILLALNFDGLNPGDLLHGRYVYLSLAGLALLFATAWHLLTKVRMPFLIAAGLVAIAFAVLTVKQAAMWKDDMTVFTTAHDIAPLNAPVARNLARAHVQAALELDAQGRCDEAIPVFDRVTKEYPDDWFAWAALGDCLMQMKDLPKAEQSLRRAADLSKNPTVEEQWKAVHDRMMMTQP